MEMLTQGRGVLSKLTIPEGLTSLQIVEKLREEDELVGDITEIPPEGSLLPDTYRFSKGMERRELLERMQGEMQRFLADRVGASPAEPARSPRPRKPSSSPPSSRRKRDAPTSAGASPPYSSTA